MSNKVINNTEVLMFILGWQGGTIHQVVEELNKVIEDDVSGAWKNFKPNSVDTYTILCAGYEEMQVLMRMAQRRHYQTRIQPLDQKRRQAAEALQNCHDEFCMIVKHNLKLRKQLDELREQQGIS